MDILRTIDLTGFVDVGFRGQRLFHNATRLHFVERLPLNSFYNQAMGRSPSLFGKAPEAGPKVGRKPDRRSRIVVVAAIKLLLACIALL